MRNVTVRDFINLCLEPNSLEFRVFDVESNRQVYQGFASDCPVYIMNVPMDSYDAPNLSDGVLTINVSIED